MRARHLTTALAVLLLAGLAAAGEAVRLQIELPPDVTFLEAGETTPIQVVGIDDEGARVGFGKYPLDFTANLGELTVKQAPYEFTYTAPKSVEKSLEVVFVARLEGARGVLGRRTVDVEPRKREKRASYLSLDLKCASDHVRYGTSVEIQVHGRLDEDRVLPVVDRRIVMEVQGAGEVVLVRPSVFRYTAPRRDAMTPRPTSVRLIAYLKKSDDVRGELTLALGRRAGVPGDVPTDTPTDAPTDAPTDQPADTPRSPADGGKSETADGRKSVLSPSGDVQFVAWRTRDAADQPWSADQRNFPPAGGDFVAPEAWQKLRVTVERDDVVGIDLQWWIGKKKGSQIHVEENGEGEHIRVKRNKSGRRVAHLEFHVPDGGRALHVELHLRTTDGKTRIQPFILRRGRDRDRDGKRDE